jgi:hypothetical protein
MQYGDYLWRLHRRVIIERAHQGYEHHCSKAKSDARGAAHSLQIAVTLRAQRA